MSKPEPATATLGAIDLGPTRALHAAAGARCLPQPDMLAAACERANQRLLQQGVVFEKGRLMPIAPSALVLRQHDVAGLETLTRRVHALVDKTLDRLIGSPALLARHFPEHRRMFPFLAKTRGRAGWQVISRYDGVLTPDGGFVIIELNTACPAGFSDMETIAQATRGALEDVGLAGGAFDLSHSANISDTAFWEELLAVEKAANIQPGTVAILNDENQLTHELELFAAGFRARGRDAVVANAADLTLRGDQLCAAGQPVSLTFNKFRLSTPESPNHCWKAGFETRYAAFLHAVTRQSVVTVNNTGGLTIGEDKGLLAVLRHPDLYADLTAAERELVETRLAWTARLADDEVVWEGKPRRLLELLKAEPARFVIKPANEGRGFRVTLGMHATPAEWEAACQIDPQVPAIVQAHVEPLVLDVLCRPDNGPLVSRPMYGTLSLASIAGKFVGCMSRVSPNPVANVARQGFNQPVFATAG